MSEQENELTKVSQLNQTHIGVRIRIQNVMGGTIEGTLAEVWHKCTEAYGKHVQTFLSFEEFTLKQDGKTYYLPVEAHVNGFATEVEE